MKKEGENKVLFLPDKNLGRFVASKTKKEIILWDGFCYVHHKSIKPKDLKRMKTNGLQRYEIDEVRKCISKMKVTC